MEQQNNQSNDGMPSDYRQAPTSRLKQSPSFENLMKAPDRKSDLRRSISDSDIALAAAPSSVWICDLCMYENVDPTRTTCALCGTKREQDSPSTVTPDDGGNSQSHPKDKDNRRESFDKGNSLISVEDGGIREAREVTADNKENEIAGSEISAAQHAVLKKSPSSLSDSENFDDVAPLPIKEKISLDPSTIQDQQHSRFEGQKDLLGESAATLVASNVGMTQQGSSQTDLDLNQMYAQGQKMMPAAVAMAGGSPPIHAEEATSSLQNVPIETSATLDPLKEDFDNHDELFRNNASANGEDINLRVSNISAGENDDFELEQLYETGISRMQNKKNFPSSGKLIPLDIPEKREEGPVQKQRELHTIPQSPEPKDYDEAIPRSVGDIEEDNPSKYEDPSKETVSTNTNKYILRVVIILVALIVVVLSFALVGGKSGEDNQPVSGDLVTTSPSASPTPQLTNSLTTTPTPDQTKVPTVPTSAPTEELQQDFAPADVDIVGSVPGSRFGTSVSLDSGGGLLAATGDSGLDGVRIYERDTENGWDLLPVIDVDPLTVFSGSSSVSVSSSSSVPTVAIASISSFGVMQYVDEDWIPMGQESLSWVTSNDEIESTVSTSGVALSSDGTVLAAGFLNLNKDSIVVRVFEWRSSSMQWEQRGDPIIRIPPTVGLQFLSMSLALSENGQVVSIGDWLLSNPASSVDTFEWTDNGWITRGATLSFFWGPAQVSLSHDGHRLGVTIPSPESTHIYEWNGIDEFGLISRGIPGASSIAMNGGGIRIIVGRASSSEVSVYDNVDGAWVDMSTVTGEVGSRFGAAVSVSSSGNVIAVGSPLDGARAGSVVVYQ